MELEDEDGYFAAFVSGRENPLPAYHYQVRELDGELLYIWRVRAQR